jgi:hypothetical protein
VEISVHAFLSDTQWKTIQKLGLHTQGKIMEYLKWIKSSFPYCSNDSPQSACRLIRDQTAKYIDFILKNHHSNWADFHTKIQELESERLNEEVLEWCIINNFDLSPGD